ncbi:uncharacterized protein [Primulina eburnea]|uniref:uncharacterized protein isoform X2 n=1 Tax=Primulina eburnea TaxID=1245227 RepID=UPI003C6C5D71
MEATSSGEHTPNNNDVTNQQQRSTQDMTNSSFSSYIIERRQMLTDNERERIHSMTQQRRQSYLARHRSNYQIRRMEFTSSISTSNQHDQQINWRLTQRTRQRSINEDARNMELAYIRTNYRRRQDNERSSIPDESNLGSNDFVAPNTMIQESTHNIGENLRQTCRSEPISFHTLTSNYERGSSSRRLPRPNYVHQDQQINWRLTQRTRQQSINEDARNMELARGRTNYRRRQDNERSSIPDESNLGSNDFVAPNTMIQESTHNIGENLVDVTTVRHTCRSEPISFHTLTSNYERGSSSTRLPKPNSVHQGNIFNENNVIFNIQRYPRPRRYHNLARNFGEIEINYRWQLSEPRICIHCQDVLFHGESSQFCCRNGNTNLDHIPSPIELQELYAADNEEGRHFRRFIRAYNHVFSFTSMRVNIDESLTSGTHGIYTFRAQGSIYHSIGSLLPNENCRTRYMQMWIVDTDHDIDNRLNENPDLRRELLLKIQNILDQHNPFVHVFRQIGKCEDIPNCRLIIRQQKPNEHQYILPTTSQVAVFIVDNEYQETLSSRDITIQGIGGNLISI